MNVSLQELAQRDGVVVCPQCLSAYQAVDAGTLPAPPAAAPARQHYCPHCGEDIGQGINFCPYCGGRLHDTASDTLAPHAVASTQPSQASAETKRRDSSSGSRHSSNHHRQSSRRHSGTDSADAEAPMFDWKPMIPSYRLAQHQRHEPASLGFQAFAIAIIIALVALLVFIIYHAMLLQ